MSDKKLVSETRILNAAELEQAVGGRANDKYQVILDAPKDMDHANGMVKKFCKDPEAASFIALHFGLDLEFVQEAMKIVAKQKR